MLAGTEVSTSKVEEGEFSFREPYKKAVEEVINLGGIDGEQGKAGMKFLS